MPEKRTDDWNETLGVLLLRLGVVLDAAQINDDADDEDEDELQMLLHTFLAGGSYRVVQVFQAPEGLINRDF